MIIGLLIKLIHKVDVHDHNYQHPLPPGRFSWNFDPKEQSSGHLAVTKLVATSVPPKAKSAPLCYPPLLLGELRDRRSQHFERYKSPINLRDCEELALSVGWIWLWLIRVLCRCLMMLVKIQICFGLVCNSAGTLTLGIVSKARHYTPQAFCLMPSNYQGDAKMVLLLLIVLWLVLRSKFKK